MARRDEGRTAADPTRREFFRTLGRQTVRNAGAVAGAAAELRRAGGIAARELLDIGADNHPAGVDRMRPAGAELAPSFRSAYRLADEALLILDQRDLPGRTTILTCSEPSEVASAIRSGAINSGPVLGEIAAYMLVVALARAGNSTGSSAGSAADGRDQVFRAAANTLRGARREVHALRTAVDRMEDRFDSLTAAGTGSGGLAALTDAMRAEANAIATEAQLAHSALGRSGAELIAAAADANQGRTSTEPISLLMHGDAGPLSCGMVGTGTRILESLLGLDLKVHVWLTEVAPGMEGARISALQLTQIDVPHTVIADTAVGWLLASRRLDGALLRGDTVATNAATVTVIGGLNVARLAAGSGVPVYMIAPASAFDAQSFNGWDSTLDLRSPAEQMAGSTGDDGHGRPAVFGVHLNPTADIVPGDLVTAFLTETGPRARVRS